MRITIDIDDELMAAARRAAGVAVRARVIEIALRALVATAARRRLAAMHGALPMAKAPPRRRGGAGQDRRPSSRRGPARP